jgi:hypothetical protein
MAGELSGETLLEVLAGVLEDAAFITGEPVEPGAWAADGLLLATLTLGDGLGEVAVRAEGAFALLLAANLLGEEPDAVDAASGREAMAELLNMVAGGLVKAAGGHSMGLPSVRPAEAGSDARWSDAGARAAMVTDEGQRVEIAWWPLGGGAA